MGKLLSLEERLSQLSPQTSQDNSIYKVPRHLRDVNKKAFEPLIVAIGPYNRGRHELKRMEEVKLRYMQKLLSRKPVRLEHYISAVEEMAEKAFECYAEPPMKLDSADRRFIDMLVLDGCFIIEVIDDRELFLRSFPDRSSYRILQRDLILLENQIPFFVLCKLFDLIREPEPHSLLMEQVLIFCVNVFPGNILYRDTTNRKSVDVKHILDLIHSNCCQGCCASTTISSSVQVQQPVEMCCESATISSSVQVQQPVELSCESATISSTTISSIVQVQQPVEMCCESATISSSVQVQQPVQGCCASTTISSSVIPSASELKDANVKFGIKRYDSPPYSETANFQEGGCTRLFDVEFNDSGKMVMPTLVIDDWTEGLLRNLIAYEQLFPTTPSYFVDYATLLDCLINTSKDVLILCRENIIENLLGSEEAVVNFVNRLTDGVMLHVDSFVYADTFRRINLHRQNCWNGAVATLHRNYFNTPWAYIAFVAALILFLLTAAQTIFSALQL